MTRLFQVTTPTSCAGFVYASGIIRPYAPILGYMAKWSLLRIERYCRAKRYTLEEIHHANIPAKPCLALPYRAEPCHAKRNTP